MYGIPSEIEYIIISTRTLTEFRSNKVATESLNESITPLAHTTYNSLVAMSMAHAQYFRDRKMRCRIPA